MKALKTSKQNLITFISTFSSLQSSHSTHTSDRNSAFPSPGVFNIFSNKFSSNSLSRSNTNFLALFCSFNTAEISIFGCKLKEKIRNKSKLKKNFALSEASRLRVLLLIRFNRFLNLSMFLLW